jgi:DNA-directed RNA polymerase subunit RPC12/RpoP
MLRQTSRKTYLYTACPRCHGDLVLDAGDQNPAVDDQLEYVCLQCGRHSSVETGWRARKLAAASRAA